MKKRRIPIWAMALLAVPCAIGLFVLGLWTFVSVTATPIHPDPAAIPSVSQSAPAAKWNAAVADAQQLARTTLARENWPGISVAVGIGGELVWAEGFGYADLDDKTPVAPSLRFKTGTTSMTLTSVGAGLLIEQGKLKLDDEIQTYVPTYPKRQWPVTLRQLMAHTSGVKTDAGDEGPFGEHCDRPVDGLKLFKNKDLSFEPDTRFLRSTFGWILVSAAMESASGEGLTTFMRTQVFSPLGMEDTTPDSKTDPVPGRATFYFPRFAADNKYGPEEAQQPDYSCYAGAYIFLSTASDLVRFGMGVNGGKLLKPDTVQLLQTSQRLKSGEETGVGLGWDIKSVDLGGKAERAPSHNGQSIGGTVMSLLTVPERGLVVAVMTNTSWADTFVLAKGIAAVFAR